MEGIKIYSDIKEVATSSIKAYVGSHNTDIALEMLKESISKFGIQNPIVIDKDNNVVAGNGIFKAARELGYETVPVVYADELTEDQIKQYRIADNKTSEFASWNEKKLRKELSYLQSPEDLQFCFDDNLTAMIGFAPMAPSVVKKEKVAVTQEEIKAAQEKAMQSQQKFKEDLKSIEQGLNRKPCNFFEYYCSNCGKKVIVKIW